MIAIECRSDRTITVRLDAAVEPIVCADMDELAALVVAHGERSPIERLRETFPARHLPQAHPDRWCS